jgi:hypothetical protein
MKLFNGLILLLVFFANDFIVFAQIPTPTQEYRGLWVSQFKTNVLGNTAAEDALIAYAIANDFNYLICTNMFQILTENCGSFTLEMLELQAFIYKAHIEGIQYISGNVGSLTTAEKIQEYNNCVSVSSLQKLDMITYECEFYNDLTNGSCENYTSFIGQLSAIKAICVSTESSEVGRPLVCEAYIGGEGSTGLVLTNSSEAEMEEIATLANHILLTYYRPLPSSSGGNFFNWTIDRLKWIAKTGAPSNIVLLLKSRNTDGNNMNAYLSTFPGTHYNALRDPYLSWVEGTAHNPTLTKGFREKYEDGTYPWLSGIQIKGFTWFEHSANMALNPLPLPVNFLSFDAVCNGNSVDLSWTISSETNNKYFTIGKSVDGRVFKTIAKIDAIINNSEITEYEFNDTKELNGLNYYRIKQTDFDGKYTYFKSVAINCKSSENEIFIKPNPTDNSTFEIVLAKKSKVSITNILGQIIIEKDYGIGLQIIKLNQPSGLYFVNIVTENSKSNHRLILK